MRCGPNRDLPLVSVRTLLPLAEYLQARLSAAKAGVDETSGLTADLAVRARIAGSAADLGPEIVADDDAEGRQQLSEAELHQIKMRLHQGERQKAAGDELRLPLPAGLAYARDGRIGFNPDEEVQGRLFH